VRWACLRRGALETSTSTPPGSGFTALFEALALSLCQERSVRQAAGLLRCSDKQLWRRIEHYVGEARTIDYMSAVRVIGID
jgi:transposase